jgi:large subunit ribosomal protein L10
MPTPQKEQKVKLIKEKLGQAQGFILTDFKGVTVKDISNLRRRLRTEKVEYRIFKNNLARIAVSEFGYAAIEKHMIGTTAIAIAYGDPIAPLKVLHEFEKVKKIPLKAGVINGEIFNADQLIVLRSIPAMPQLRSIFLSVLQSPARGFVTVVSAGVRGLVQVLSQHAKKMEEGNA